MSKRSQLLAKSVELRLLLLVVGFCLISWPSFRQEAITPLVLYSALFLAWLGLIAVLLILSKAGDD